MRSFRSVVIYCCVLSSASAISGNPLLEEARHPSNTQYHSQGSQGQYKYGYSNALSSKEETRSEDGTTRGSYSYVDANGVLQTVSYIADAVNGFKILSKDQNMIQPEAPQNERQTPTQNSSPQDSTSNDDNPSQIIENPPIASKLSPINFPTIVTDDKLGQYGNSLAHFFRPNQFLLPSNFPSAIFANIPNYSLYPVSNNQLQKPVFFPVIDFGFGRYRQYHSQNALGHYSYGYANELSSKDEVKGSDGVTRGSYSYVDPNGKLQTVSYTADANNGFRVVATNLPVGPVATQLQY